MEQLDSIFKDSEFEKACEMLNKANEKIENDITESVNRWLANYKIICDNTNPLKSCCIGTDYTRDFLYDLVNYFRCQEDGF